MQKTIVRSIRIEEKLLDKIKAEAKRLDRTPNYIINSVLKEKFNKTNPKGE